MSAMVNSVVAAGVRVMGLVVCPSRAVLLLVLFLILVSIIVIIAIIFDASWLHCTRSMLPSGLVVP